MMVAPPVDLLDEFERWLTSDEAEDGLWELIDGGREEKAPTEFHNFIVLNLYRFLYAFVDARGLGRIVTETRYRAPGDRRNSRLPDSSLTRTERLQPLVKAGAVIGLPDLCVEVQSPNDRPSRMRAKAACYPANGAQQVWLVYTDKPRMEVIYADGEFDMYSMGQILMGGDWLPGFEMPLSLVFAE